MFECVILGGVSACVIPVCTFHDICTLCITFVHHHLLFSLAFFFVSLKSVQNTVISLSNFQYQHLLCLVHHNLYVLLFGHSQLGVVTFNNKDDGQQQHRIRLQDCKKIMSHCKTLGKVTACILKT